MKTKNEAADLVKKSIGTTMSVSLLRDHSNAFVFLCTATDPEAIPNKIIAAVNKDSGNIGYSLLSVEDAVKKVG